MYMHIINDVGSGSEQGTDQFTAVIFEYNDIVLTFERIRKPASN